MGGGDQGARRRLPPLLRLKRGGAPGPWGILRAAITAAVAAWLSAHAAWDWLVHLPRSNNTGSMVIILFLPLPPIIGIAVGGATFFLDLALRGVPTLLVTVLAGVWLGARFDDARQRHQAAADLAEQRAERAERVEEQKPRAREAPRRPRSIPPSEAELRHQRVVDLHADLAATSPHARARAVNELAADVSLIDHWRLDGGALSNEDLDLVRAAAKEGLDSKNEHARTNARAVFRDLVLKEEAQRLGLLAAFRRARTVEEQRLWLSALADPRWIAPWDDGDGSLREPERTEVLGWVREIEDAAVGQLREEAALLRRLLEAGAGSD